MLATIKFIFSVLYVLLFPIIGIAIIVMQYFLIVYAVRRYKKKKEYVPILKDTPEYLMVNYQIPELLKQYFPNKDIIGWRLRFDFQRISTKEFSNEFVVSLDHGEEKNINLTTYNITNTDFYLPGFAKKAEEKIVNIKKLISRLKDQGVSLSKEDLGSLGIISNDTLLLSLDRDMKKLAYNVLPLAEPVLSEMIKEIKKGKQNIYKKSGVFYYVWELMATYLDLMKELSHLGANDITMYLIEGNYCTDEIFKDMIANGTVTQQFETAKKLYKNQYTEGYRRKVAVNLFAKAAYRGNAEATYYLAECFNRGWGVEENSTYAGNLYRRANSSGYSCTNRLDILRLEEKWSPEENDISSEILEQLMVI